MTRMPTSAYRLSRDAEEEYARLMTSPRSSTSALSDRTLVFSVWVPRLPPRSAQHRLPRAVAHHLHHRPQHHVPPNGDRRAHPRVDSLPLRYDVLASGLRSNVVGVRHRRDHHLSHVLRRIRG